MTNEQTLDCLRELTREGYPYRSIVQTADRDIHFLDNVSRRCSTKEEVAKYFYED